MTTAAEPVAVHRILDCGIELAVLPLHTGYTVCAELRMMTGFCQEPADKLGLNYILEECIAKGTTQRSGQDLFDAFDAIGARWDSWAGREASGFYFTCLPEFLDQTLVLHAEYMRRPSFDAEGIQVAIDLTKEEILHAEDDPQDLAGVLFNRQVYGPVLGRHVLGEKATLDNITREDVVAFWQKYYNSGRLQVSVVGPVDPDQVARRVTELFGGWGSAEREGRAGQPWQFEAKTTHHHKELEQQQIGICYPGATLDDPRRYAQKVAMGVLSGGMSCRLFTELREKQGLVYWVTAWTEHPRAVGIVYLGASSTPARCDKTYNALLGEVDRLTEDLQEDELRRAITGLVSKAETRGAATRARCSELSSSMFHYARVVPRSEVIAALEAVTMQDVREYLQAFPRNALSVLTLGPRELDLTAAS